MTSSAAYPSLERKPGGPDNWVERVGGLPQYIERIAKHLHYEKGMPISEAIAVAVNTVKRWARKGSVVKWGDPKHHNVTMITAAQAAKDVAEWEAKKAMARGTGGGGRRSGRLPLRSVRLSEEFVDFKALAERANRISDPAAKAAARRSVLDLAIATLTPEDKAAQAAMIKEARDTIKTLGPMLTKVKNEPILSTLVEQIQNASSIISRGRWWNESPTSVSLSVEEQGYIDLALTKDGRKSFKRQGKWGHGFVPLDAAARQAKAKGSPIAAKRVQRLFGGAKTGVKDTKTVTRADRKANEAARAAQGAAHGQAIRSNFGGSTVNLPQKGKASGVTTERVQNVGQSLHADIRKTAPTQHQNPPQHEVGKGRRGDIRARQAWDQIPASQKTIRNGTRYVMSVFHGQNVLTAWVGNESFQAAPDASKRQYLTVREQDLQNLTTGQIRRLLKSGKQSPEAMKVMRRVLNAKMKKINEAA